MAKDALDVACELLAGEDGACPALLYDWKHPEGCLWLYDTTKPGMGTCTRHRRCVLATVLRAASCGLCADGKGAGRCLI
jgi:hypothetical protein